MANLVVPPYDIYADANGDPLEDGYIYIGEPGLSPINSPLQAYWDSDLSIPANNIRTKGGYPSNSGTPGRLYTATNYSILVQDVRGATLYTNLDSVDYVNSASGSLIALVDTIAELRGLALASPDDQASVGGSVTVGDGLMGPLYYWDENGAGIDNGVSIIKPTSTVGNGRWLWINTNAPMETVNISASATVTLNEINKIFLVNAALAVSLTIPDGTFQGQFITIAQRGVGELTITGTGFTAGTIVLEEAYLTWLGTAWGLLTSQTSFSDLTVTNDLTVENSISVDIINEYTTDAGVTIEGVLLKDGTLNVSNISENTPDTWSQIGNSLNISGISDPALAALTDTDVAFIDATNGELRTYRFNGTDWAQVGSSLSIGAGTSAISSLSTTDIALIDVTNTELRTYSFDGNNWSQVGNGLSVATGSPALASLSSTEVAFVSRGSNFIRKYSFDGTDWTQVGNSLSIAYSAPISATALNSTDILVASNADDNIKLYRFNGTDWYLVPATLSITGMGNTGITAINGKDATYFDGTLHTLSTHRYEGNWTLRGNTLDIAIGGATDVALTALSQTRVALIDEINMDLRTYEYSITAAPPTPPFN